MHAEGWCVGGGVLGLQPRALAAPLGLHAGGMLRAWCTPGVQRTSGSPRAHVAAWRCSLVVLMLCMLCCTPPGVGWCTNALRPAAHPLVWAGALMLCGLLRTPWCGLVQLSREDDDEMKVKTLEYYLPRGEKVRG